MTIRPENHHTVEPGPWRAPRAATPWIGIAADAVALHEDLCSVLSDPSAESSDVLDGVSRAEAALGRLQGRIEALAVHPGDRSSLFFAHAARRSVRSSAALVHDELLRRGAFAGGG